MTTFFNAYAEKSEIAELNKKIDKLLEAYLENILSVGEYQTKKQNLIELKSQLEVALLLKEKYKAEWIGVKVIGTDVPHAHLVPRI